MVSEVADIPKELCPAVQQMLRKCFEHDSTLRPTFSEIYNVLDQNWTNMNAPMLPPRPAALAQASEGSRESDLTEAVVAGTHSDTKSTTALNPLPGSAHKEFTYSLECPQPLVSSPPAAKEMTVRVMTYDRQILEFPLSVAKRSATLQWQMEQKGQQQEGNGLLPDPITLEDPSCTLAMISKVSAYLQVLLEAEQGLKEVDDLRKAELMLTDVDEDGVFALLMVANYLDIPELTYLACHGLKSQMENDIRNVTQPGRAAADAGAHGSGIPCKTEAEQIPTAAKASSVESAKKKSRRVSSDVHAPELPPRKHRFDRAVSPGGNKQKLTRSRSSPAKPHQLVEATVVSTSQVLSETDMRRMIPGYRSPSRQHFLPGVGVIESIADWGKSSWSDLVQPRFALAAMPTSPACKNLNPKAANVGAERLPQAKVVSESIHCTPFVNRAPSISNSNPLGALSAGVYEDQLSSAESAHSQASAAKGPCASETLFRLEFRRMIHPDGDRYVGTCRGDLMHGIGICWYANGDKYYGQWRAGMRHGMGRMEWCDRHIYEGTWREDIVCPGLKSKRMSKENLGIGM